MKNTITAILLSLILLSLASCGNEQTPALDSPAQPNCTETGSAEGSHSSDRDESLAAPEEVEKLEHIVVVDQAVAPTCTATGLTEGSHCSECGEVLTAQEVVAKLKHTIVVDNAVAPTCTETGLTEGSHCSVCDTILTKQTAVQALGHLERIDKAIDATSFETGLTEGSHCERCHAVLIAQEVIPTVSPVKINFPSGTVTDKPMTLRTKHLQIEIPASAFIPDNFVETVDYLTDVVEKVSGMKYAGNPLYASDLLIVKVDDQEHPHASASDASVQRIDLIEYSILIHEATHTLQYRQSNWSYCTWAMEGITTYTKYKVREYIAKQKPELIEVMMAPNQSICDYEITDYSKLYEHSMEYWMDHTFEYSVNSNYSIGFRFMYYLDKTYGNYTEWIYAMEKENPFFSNCSGGDMLPYDQQAKIFKSVYGETVFEDFYAWLKNNESVFTDEKSVDMTMVETLSIYPIFVEETSALFLLRSCNYRNANFRDLYIDLEAGRKYLTDALNRKIKTMNIQINFPDVSVRLFDAEGRLIATHKSTEIIDVTDVSFIQLVGKANVSWLGIEAELEKP